MQKSILFTAIIALTLAVSLFPVGVQADPGGSGDDLTGAWRGKVQIKSGAYADVKDLEFMYAFNAGGTMTESSNYDASPPGPPAYGIWKKTGALQYEAKYLVFQTVADSIFNEIGKGGGWLPDGYGVLTEKITLSPDGNSYDSSLTFDIFDQQGKLTTKGGNGVCKAERIKF